MTSASYDITFVTYDRLPEGDPDDRLALDLLSQRDYRTQCAVWNDPGADWSKAGLCILRSTWDYYLHFDAFVSWLQQVSTTARLLNPIELAIWNTNKCVYLRELVDRGAPVVDTVFVARGTDVDLKAILDKQGWQCGVIKPGIGAGTHNVQRISNEPASISAGQRHLQAILATGDALIQQYLSAVDTDGERALVFIDGTYSHTVSKTAFQSLLPAGQAGEKPVVASPKDVEIASKVVALVRPTPLYARIDLIPDNEGHVKLLELELLEPSLFLSMDANAPVTFADAIEKRLARDHHNR
jgi:hypothetical protein